LNIKAEQKYGNRGTKKIGTRLARRNELNLYMEQKYRDRDAKKRNEASTKERIEFKHGTKI
jgi:hypothetical protein